MTTLSDEDWDMINAWADNELPKADMRRVQNQIDTDPEWSKAAASIKGVSAALSELHPVSQTPANTNRKLWPLSLAAGFAAACALVIGLILPLGGLSPEDIHQSYLDKNFPLSNASHMQSAAGQVVDGFPTLSAANLALVATNPDPETSSAHYVGKNGCRLTLIRQTQVPISDPETALSHGWQIADVHFLAIATDMDLTRFQAISAYLKTATANQIAPQVLVDLQDAVQTAAPCNLRQV